MSAKRNLLGKPRKMWGLCKASTCAPNVATHKTGYCDFHHAEYSAAKKRHNDMKYNFSVGRSSRRPASWAEYLSALHFTPMAEATGAIDERVTTLIAGVLDEVERAQNINSTSADPPPALGQTLERIRSTLTTLVDSSHADRPDNASTTR